MATSEEVYSEIMEKLSKIGEFTSRKMMGEYCVYYKGKMVAEICDGRFLLKTTDSVRVMMSDAPQEYPYEGSKTLMTRVTDFDDTESLGKVIEAAYSELPEPRKKAKRS